MTARTRSSMLICCLMLAGVTLAGCGGDGQYAYEDAGGPPVREDEYDPNDSIFGGEGFTAGRLFDGTLLGGSTDDQGNSLPVNKFLWQASLDTLSFLPLASTDPFTGVIATDWGASPTTPGERFKVTAYMVRPALAASSLKVAVYREVRNEEGVWVPAPVDPETSRKLEDAIIVRARQIRIAELEGTTTG